MVVNETTILLSQNVPANGTIAAGEKLNFAVFFPDWRYAIWGLQMDMYIVIGVLHFLVLEPVLVKRLELPRLLVRNTLLTCTDSYHF